MTDSNPAKVIENPTVCVVGLGYVGLPLATAFSRKLRVIGFDIDAAKVASLSREKANANLSFTTRPEEITGADFVILCLPTLVDDRKDPDESFLRAAAKTVGGNLKKGAVVILESTVYPGLTEEMLVPALEEAGIKCGRDFKVAYSPERINPGDDEHSIEKVTKVVAGMDAETTETVAQLYGQITPNVFKARDIRTAEASKLVENIQRDVNIALANEFAVVFAKMGISRKDVFEAAATKWNFHRYSPGLVGGHCIPVVPHFLVYKSRQAGYDPRMITTGRDVSDAMPGYVAALTVEGLEEAGKAVKGSRVLVMGLTYKEDVADTRDSPVKEVIAHIKERGAEPVGYDPLLVPASITKEFSVDAIENLDEAGREPFDAIVLAVVHAPFRQLDLAALGKLQRGRPVLVDLRGRFDDRTASGHGIIYKTL